MRYARLTPGPGFRPVNSFLYYLQRIVVPPRLRGLCIRAFRQWVRLRRGGSASAKTISQCKLVAAMHDAGYATLGTLLTKRQCDDIHRYFSDKILTGRGEDAGGFTIAQVPANARLADYCLRDIVRSPHILELANDRRLLELATSYIGCKPTISQLGLRWSFPTGGTRADLQTFHRDSEDWRYFKVLVYLTDVGPGDGPHIYVQGAHKTRASIRLRVHSDSEIMGQYGADRLIVATGKRGFGFAVDTAGVHKGSLPVNSPRLMLQIQYSLFRSYAYDYEPQPYRGWPPFDRYINRLILSYRR